ncbi:MAG: hypothetical protein KBG20_12985 [Caldilineaceae bacterium]|nr:hypothetical protein [Caldilineaceae bacterium]MBP8109901.1 hypothetical protein [Caldilineaceae bacterium]MBP8125433.1 hypothetical protein [Caldilineaceae bacterium]MBP9073212.1 hypothetical protein [Caldilineaceae bacterium]
MKEHDFFEDGQFLSNRKRILNRIRKIWATLGAIALVIFVGWSLIAYRASDTARQALIGDAQVEVVRGEYFWHFAAPTPAPTPASQPLGMLFFAGSLVDPVAYAPLARTVAQAGYPVLLVELPRRGAFGGADGDQVMAWARAAMQEMPTISQWLIAGHSKGGAVAARFVNEGWPGAAGLALVGTSHPRDFSLAHVTMPIVKILGTRDGLSSVEKSETNRQQLPAATRWVLIEGGNHSQFGWYGFQPGDRTATIDREAQQAQTLQVLLDTLHAIHSGIN